MNKLLVANRGEIALRVFRTARRMGLATVAVFSDPDADAPHVAAADEAVHLPGATPGDTYLDLDRVLAAALATGADAIHPGYGFLSENAEFARACAAAGITFVGPSPEAIEAMGSKIAAKELMAAAGVPVLGAEGFPLLVKAAFGGGGRGMRIVRSESELAGARAEAEREAASAFGDGTVFVERYLEEPRHIEVQIFGDHHGNVIHLFERECSIQRRYQKIIEEAPSPAVDADLRDSLCSAAVTAARTLGYVGAGTVEFVVDGHGDFFFLEVNTRLQVEHPVTELVTGLDLVEMQLRVAQGEALDVTPVLRGHAVEARIYAEDVAAGFVPVSGRIERFHVPAHDRVRVDAGYEAGSTVSTFYDAMLAKVIAVGDSRPEAIDRLAEALAGTRVHGVQTNLDLLVSVLRHPAFLDGRTDTGFLDRHDLVGPAPATGDGLFAVAAALADCSSRRAAAQVQPAVPAGWRNVATQLQRARYRLDERDIEVGYAHTRSGLVLEVDAEPLGGVELWSASPSLVDLGVEGVRRRYEVHRVGRRVFVDGPTGSAVLDDRDLLPEPGATTSTGSLQAPLPGSVVRLGASVGDRVEAGATLVVLEAMKMEHSVRCATAGVVTEVLVAVGDQVDGGQVLAVVDAESDEAEDGTDG